LWRRKSQRSAASVATGGHAKKRRGNSSGHGAQEKRFGYKRDERG